MSTSSCVKSFSSIFLIGWTTTQKKDLMSKLRKSSWSMYVLREGKEISLSENNTGPYECHLSSVRLISLGLNL